MTFGETPNPRKNVPRAVKQTFWRIAVFYILGILVLGMAVPYNSEKLIGATKQATSGGKSLDSQLYVAITDSTVELPLPSSSLSAWPVLACSPTSSTDVSWSLPSARQAQVRSNIQTTQSLELTILLSRHLLLV